MCTLFIHMYTSSIHICDIIHSCVHIIHLYVNNSFTCVNHSFTCVASFVYVHIIHSYAGHGFANQTLLFSCVCLVHVCVCVMVCACVSATPIWNDDPCILCVVRVCTFTYVCVSVYLFCAGDPPHAQVMSLLRRCGKFTKIMSEKWARFPPPLLKYSRETDYFLVSTAAFTVTRTHAQAYAHAHNLWHAHAAHSNTSAHSHTHISTHAQNTCMLTHAQMQTHIDTWTHTKMQVIDTKDIDIDALALDFVTNLSLNAE